jgi:hypothetical protein
MIATYADAAREHDLLVYGPTASVGALLALISHPLEPSAKGLGLHPDPFW